MNYKINILPNDRFPPKLKNIKNPPEKLYYIGDINLLYKDSFAIVGSRKVSEYGIKICEYFAKEIALRDIPIVSGMAEGTDSVAHKTAVKNNGYTIAVLGSGFKYIYPEKNIGLLEDIINNKGLAITEYEPNIKPFKKSFPKRNRIISAISEGVLVVEAAYRSGTSITANYARTQGKNVFAIPGRLDNYLSTGVNKLIKDGAILTTKIEDILYYYPQFANKMRKTSSKNSSSLLKDEYKEIYKLLKEEMSIDEIIQLLNTNVVKTLEIISNMEIEGIIEKTEIGKYKIKEDKIK